MRLALGSRSFDLTTRALVVGVIDGDPAAPADDWVRRAEEEVAARIDVMEVPAGVVGTIASRVDISLAVTVDGPKALVAAVGAGAAMVRIRGFDPAWLTAPVVDGPTLVVGAPIADGEPSPLPPDDMALACEAAGLGSHRVAVDLGDGPGDRARSGAWSKVASRPPAPGLRVGTTRWPRLVSLPGSDPAAVAMAVLSGCRLIRTADVVGARRVVDVLTAILDHRRESPT